VLETFYCHYISYPVFCNFGTDEGKCGKFYYLLCFNEMAVKKFLLPLYRDRVQVCGKNSHSY